MGISDDKLVEYRINSIKRDTASLLCALIRLVQIILFFLWGTEILELNLLLVFAPTIAVFFIFCWLLIVFFIARHRYSKKMKGCINYE